MIFTSTLLFFLLTVTGFTAGNTYTLDNLIQASLSNSIQMKNARNSLNASGLRLKSSSSDFWPTLSLSMSHSRSGPDSSYENGTFSNRLSLGYTLFDGFRTRLSYKTSLLNIEISEESLYDASREVTANTLYLYYDFLKYSEQMGLYLKELEIAKKRKEEIDVKIGAGLAIKSDLIKTEIDITNIEINILKLKDNIEKTVVSIKSYTGIKELASGNLDKDIREVSELPDKYDPLTKYLENAYVKRSDMKIISRQRIRAEYALKQSNASKYPRLSLSGGLSASGPELFPPDYGWTAGLSLSYGLFSGYIANMADIELKKNDIETVSIDEENLKRAIEYELTQYYLSYIEAIERKKLALKNADQSKQILEIEQEKYSLGLSSILEMRDAELIYEKTNLELIDAVYDIGVNYIKLNNSSGLEFYPVTSGGKR